MDKLKTYKIRKGVLLLSFTLNTVAGLMGTGKLFKAIGDYQIVKEITNGDSINTIADIRFDDNRFRSGKYSKEDFFHAKEVKIKLFDNHDYTFLNDMPNLEKLEIMDYRSLPLDELDGSIFTKDITVKIISCNNISSFSEERYAFLKDIPSINTLILQNSRHYNTGPLCALNIESGFLESLHNVSNLTLYVNDELFYNYKDLTFLDSLSLEGKPYNVAMFFNNKDLNNLKDAGVVVTTRDMDTLVKANNDIDKIIEGLNILPTDGEKEKINKVLLYILENYSYDPNVAKWASEDKKYLIDHSKFYGDGVLQGSLKGETQICGNYAAMFAALAHCLDLKADYVYNNTHAWDLVKVGDKYYYIDPTILEHEEICYIQEEVVPIVRETKSHEKVLDSMVVETTVKAKSFEKALADDTVGNYSTYGYMDDISAPEHTSPIVFPVDLYVTNNVDSVLTKPEEIDENIKDISNDELVLRFYGQEVKAKALILIPFIFSFASISWAIKQNNKDIKELEKTL